jgi:peroxiredoxin
MFTPPSVLLLLTVLASPPAPEAVRRIDPPSAPGALAPNLVASGEEEALLTWLEPVGEHGEGRPRAHRLRFARLKKGVWSQAATIAQGEGLVANWADFPSVARGADGTLVAHWAERSGSSPYAYDVLLGRSTDGGKTWRRLGPAHEDKTQTEHGFVSMLAEGKGVRAFWLDGRQTAGAHGAPGAGAMTLRTAVVGGSVKDGEAIDVRVCDCCGTSAAMTSEGPVVVYRDRDENEVRDISLIRRTREGWSRPRPVSAEGWRIAGCPVNGPAVAARGKRVAVAWYTYAGERPRVRLAFSEDAGASFGAPLEVDGPEEGRMPLGRVDVVLEKEGAALVSWLSAEREEAAVLVRRVTADRRMGSPLRVARSRAGRESGFARMERLGDSLVLAWTEPGTPSQVRAARVAVAEVPAATLPADGAEARRTLAEPLAVGQPAPGYAAVDLEGRAVSLAGERGRVVLVNLWATWCEPCRFEFPELVALHERHAAKGLRVIGVSVDAERTRAELGEFVSRRKLPYTLWHDPEGRALESFRAMMLPANFLIDRSGSVVWRRLGAVSAEDPSLKGALERALAAP